MQKLMVIASFLFSSQIMAQSPVVVNAPLDHLYIPNGFDNNDNVELVVTGKFPNPCFTRNKVEVNVKGDLIKVEVTSLSSDDSRRTLCEDLKVPFSEVIPVGNLQAGDYRVIVNNSLEGKLEVAVSGSASVDEHLYAQVEYIDLGFTGGLGGEALLVGNSLSPCLAFDRVEYTNNGKDTWSILPIMKKISSTCPEKKKRIHIPVKIDISKLKEKNLLLFVRSVDGKSVHSFIER
jgi:hypothetical protein